MSLSTKKIIYRSYNLPEVIVYKTLPPNRYTIIDPMYVLLYQAQFSDNIEYVSTLDALRNKVHTYNFETRATIKKTPPQVMWKGVWWKIDFPDSMY